MSRLSWIDLVVIGILAVGVFGGFTQGMIRYVLNCISVIVAFILASQLKGPIHDLLSFWTAFTPGGRELLIFVILFFIFVIAGWFVIKGLYHRTTLPVPKQVDEIGGAIFGLLFVALLLTFHLVVYDSFFMTGGQTGGWVGGYYEVMNESLLIAFFRETLIPTAGFLARPFVPEEIAQLLGP